MNPASQARLSPTPLLLLLCALLLLSCGRPDNVAACERFFDKLYCGDFDPTAVTSCQIFEDLDEDATPYFDCLARHSQCSPETGLPQIGGWETCTDLLPRNKGKGG
jgi:hypothetical protein